MKTLKEIIDELRRLDAARRQPSMNTKAAGKSLSAYRDKAAFYCPVLLDAIERHLKREDRPTPSHPQAAKSD